MPFWISTNRKKWEAEKEAAAKLSKLQDELELELGRLSEKLNKGGKLDDAIVVRDVIRKMSRLRPLRILYHPTSKDYLLAATDETIQEATAKGYAVQNTFVGFVLSEPNEQTVPLMTLFWKHGDDFFNTATKEGIATGQFEYGASAQAARKSRMKESYKVEIGHQLWPRVMRGNRQLFRRSVHRGTARLSIELRKHYRLRWPTQSYLGEGYSHVGR